MRDDVRRCDVVFVYSVTSQQQQQQQRRRVSCCAGSGWRCGIIAIWLKIVGRRRVCARRASDYFLQHRLQRRVTTSELQTELRCSRIALLLSAIRADHEKQEQKQEKGRKRRKRKRSKKEQKEVKITDWAKMFVTGLSRNPCWSRDRNYRATTQRRVITGLSAVKSVPVRAQPSRPHRRCQRLGYCLPQRAGG